MSGAKRTFTVGERVRIEAATTSGEITVAPAATGCVGVVVEDDAEDFVIEQRGDLILVKPERGRRRRWSSADVHLEVPPEAELVLSCTSGDLLVDAPVRELEAGSASGDIRIGVVVRSAVVRSASGDIVVDTVGDRLVITTASGTVRVGSVGADLSVTSASGDLHVGAVGETTEVRTASGDVTVVCFEGGDLTARTLSGDIRIGVPPRRLLDVDLQTMSGALRNRLPEGDGSEPERSVALRLKTVSGDVTLQACR